MKKILIIEDEVNIARVLKLEIEYEGYEVLVEHNGKAGLESALSNNVDLILLDVMLPELSGIEVLRRIRKTNQFVPVILLTARDATHDKIIGLDYGANDYITKPFEIEEVLARIRSSLRSSNLVQEFKKNEDSNPILAIEDLVVNLEAREVKRNDKVIPLTPKEYDLLVYLLENQNKIVTREGIITTVWGYEYEGETNVVDVYIRHLRKKIEEDFDVPLIRTIRGVGYTMRKG
ncbi:DNA-binding response regulator [Gottfriedia luciferensis]|uniref:DNA-binding response regulator n=1 Tax=Gottfriedia luciferensis TaxID=178774 RepID=A0ABX2ZS54_9BACI|nr:response regulator transcription factor [Gottfriedia luciferensis]ODG92537.1 DNA-binding response regulator [Gottfriedia luciferensis]